MTSHSDSLPQVGIVLLDYRQPESTLRAVASLQAREGAHSRILWVVNGATENRAELDRQISKAGISWIELRPESDSPLPPAGTLGVIFNAGNLGYGAGNNVALRYLHACAVPFAWVLNNDTELLEGTSGMLVEAATAAPDVAAWGMPLQSQQGLVLGHRFSLRSFAVSSSLQPVDLGDPDTFLSGCSIFLRLEAAAEVGFFPEHFFLYYEDVAFSLELRRRGWRLGFVPTVKIRHEGSLTSGRRSPLVEYYTRRNRWLFAQQYFPEALRSSGRVLAYSFQKYFFRGQWMRLRMEWLAYRDFRAGRSGRVDSRP